LQAHLGSFTDDLVLDARFIVGVVSSVEAMFLGGRIIVIGVCEASRLSGRVVLSVEAMFLGGRMVIIGGCSGRVVISDEAMFLGGRMVIMSGCEASLSGRVVVSAEGVDRFIVSVSDDAIMSSRGVVSAGGLTSSRRGVAGDARLSVSGIVMGYVLVVGTAVVWFQVLGIADLSGWELGVRDGVG